MSARAMKFRPALGLLIVLASALLFPAFGKTAEAYFHGGAYKYVAGKHQEASIEVEEGLRQYPGDKNLQKLAEQIRKMKDQQKPNGGKGDDKKKDPKDKNDKQDKGKNDPDKNKDQDKDKKDGEKKPDENKDNKDPKEGKNPPGAPPPGQMSEDEAKRLLNSFADDEKKEQRERQKLLRKRMESDQDW